jgi:SRSO17 transposase
MPTSTDQTQRFAQYVAQVTAALAHRDRHEPVRAYLTGLYLPGERKSVEPLAARVDPRRVRARHQSLHHLVANAAWDDAAVLRVARDAVLAAMRGHGGVAAWIVDDTGFPKKGRHSVLRGPGQTGQVPSGGERVAGERHGQRAGRVPPLPARELDE